MQTSQPDSVVSEPVRRRPLGALTFFRSFLSEPGSVGSILPSSRYLAAALMGPFTRRAKPAHVLEIGAGTGAVTRHLGQALGDDDRLDVCEMHPRLARHLERHVLSLPQFAQARRQGRVQLFACPVQHMDRRRRYDFVIAGLPFTALPPAVVESALDHVRAVLNPGGVFSYFEYVALRRLRTWTSFGDRRRRMRSVSEVLDDHIRRFEIDRRVVLANVSPAYARHWRFTDGPGA